MKVRVLGCGTSSGVPRIGNDWGTCDPAEQRNRRTRSSILIESEGEKLLVDCGPDMREQLLATDTADLAGVIVTHDHADHCHGIDDLRQIAHHTGMPVPLHARPDTLDRLARRFAYAFKGSPLYPPVIDPRPLGDNLSVGAAMLTFADQPHGGITSLGIRVEQGDRSLGYAIDFHDMTDHMRALYAGVDVWI
jgi:phosphoribosyl 1,2-cyclic phosphate phosphodiesterase